MLYVCLKNIQLVGFIAIAHCSGKQVGHEHWVFQGLKHKLTDKSNAFILLQLTQNFC